MESIKVTITSKYQLEFILFVAAKWFVRSVSYNSSKYLGETEKKSDTYRNYLDRQDKKKLPR